MNELNYPETTKYVIVHNNEVFTNHIVEPQNCFSTGQPFMVVFDTEEEAKQAFPQAFPTLEPESTPMDNYQHPIIEEPVVEEQPITAEPVVETQV
jgi:hypothetical protein